MSNDEKPKNLGETLKRLISSEEMKKIDFIIQPDLQKLEQEQDKFFIKKISSYYILKELKTKIIFNLGIILVLIAGVFISSINFMVGSFLTMVAIAFLVYSVFTAKKYTKYLMEKYFEEK